MRLWHYKLLPYLPDLQFKGQLRELVAIMHDWRDKGTTNHILINKVMEYPKDELKGYYFWYISESQKRRMKISQSYSDEFSEFCDTFSPVPFFGWHNNEYLRICMANLYEKHKYGVGKSRITDEEWQRLCEGYKNKQKSRNIFLFLVQ